MKIRDENTLTEKLPQEDYFKKSRCNNQKKFKKYKQLTISNFL